jgi:hypothetical protein
VAEPAIDGSVGAADRADLLTVAPRNRRGQKRDRSLAPLMREVIERTLLPKAVASSRTAFMAPACIS